MKKFTLLVASFFLVGSMAVASENPVFSDNTTSARFDMDEPISFTERGIEFFVFPNGEFDFNTRPDDSQGSYFYRTAGKRGMIVAERRPVNYGVKIEHDSFGRVRRIGNTFINYDFNDRVSRIGTVYMKYNRYVLAQVGGLKIIYNRRGQIVDLVGDVKGYSRGYVVSSNHGNGNGHGSYNNNSDYDDDAHYYYKADGTKARIEDDATDKIKK